MRLVRVPYVPPGTSQLFVDDTIAASGPPARARVRATAAFALVRRPQLTVSDVRLRPGALGSVVTARLVGSGHLGPHEVLTQAVVRRHGRIVAAGTELVPVPLGGRAAVVDLLVGDARGGTVAASVWAPPR